MIKLLIIGSKGFIGSHAMNLFSKKDEYSVFGCDVSVDYTSNNYYLVDSTNANYNQIFQENEFDVCLNCSGAASVPNSIENPLRDYHLNAVNVFKMLNAIRKYNSTCKFINLSSAAVYGNPTSLPIKENQPLNPVSPYGKHKLMAEMICEEFYQDFGLATISLRIFSAYGNGLRKQLFYDLYKKSKQGDIVDLFGTGLESRDFIHVIDLLQIIELLISKGNFNGKSINAANGKEVYIKDAVELFYSNSLNKISYQFSGQNRKGDPINWVADISKITVLGYKQRISFIEGLASYYKWAKEQG